MGLSSLESGHKGVGDGWFDAGGEGGLSRGEALESDAEAELESSALKRVRGIGMRANASLAEEPRRRGKKRRRHVQRRCLAVVPATCLGDREVQNTRRLRG